MSTIKEPIALHRHVAATYPQNQAVFMMLALVAHYMAFLHESCQVKEKDIYCTKPVATSQAS
jgi:hypothetical protein